MRLSTRDATFDVVAFGPLGPDQSYARLPDGGEAWWTCDSPTPGQANHCRNVPAPTLPATPTAGVPTPVPSATVAATAGAHPLPRRGRVLLPALLRSASAGSSAVGVSADGGEEPGPLAAVVQGSQ